MRRPFVATYGPFYKNSSATGTLSKVYAECLLTYGTNTISHLYDKCTAAYFLRDEEEAGKKLALNESEIEHGCYQANLL
jgi:hypothetical protein